MRKKKATYSVKTTRQQPITVLCLSSQADGTIFDGMKWMKTLKLKGIYEN